MSYDPYKDVKRTEEQMEKRITTWRELTRSTEEEFQQFRRGLNRLLVTPQQIADHINRMYMDNNVPSVKFEVPNLQMQETIIKHVTPFMDSVTAAGKKGGIFTVLTKDDQGRMIGNAVVAVKVGENVEIAGYIGKTWGTKDSVVYGVESRIFF